MTFEISKADTLLMAKRVFKNAMQDVEKDCPLEWGNGEDFLSLALEHFLYGIRPITLIFSKKASGPISNTPKAQGEHLPVWLDKNLLFRHAPGSPPGGIPQQQRNPTI